MTRTQSAKLVAMIATRWPVPAWQEDEIILWAELLEDLDADATARVVRDLMRSAESRPDLAAIRRAVAKSQQQPGTFLAPDEAWAFVMQCFGSVGQYRDFPNTYPLVKRAVDGIGWHDMCRSETLEVLRAQFRMAYSALLERSLVETAVSAGASAIPTAVLPESDRRARLLS